MIGSAVLSLAWSDDQGWRKEGACVGWTPTDHIEEIDDPFFDRSAKAQRKAAEFCKEVCPVLESCGAWALVNDERSGVWGGMTERDRLKLKQKEQRQQQVRGTVQGQLALLERH